MRDTLIYAWLAGFIDRLPNDSSGRTHEINQDWNVAYDRGRAVAAWIIGEATMTPKPSQEKPLKVVGETRARGGSHGRR